MTGSPDYSLEKLRTLLLRYLEGSVSQEEEKEVSRLLRTSREASRELEELRRLMQTLKTDKTVFCPHLSGISEFVTSGHDPDGTIAAHLNECPSCREEALSFKNFQPAATIPPEIWETVSGKFAELSQRVPSPESTDRPSPILAWFSSLFRMPVLAIGSAAAIAVLLVVFLYPRHPAGTVIALSSVSWEADLTTKLPVLPRDRERVAFLIVHKDFKTRVSQQRVDSWYEMLAPDEQEQKRYDIADPSRVKEAFAGVSPNAPFSKGDAILLQKKLGVQKVVVVTFISEENQLKIRGESIDTASGEPVGRAVEAVATNKTLDSTLRKIVYGSLNLQGGTSSPQ